MAEIDWNSSGHRVYEAGLDRVVLYTYGHPAVPWFGVASLEESSYGGEIESFYRDGIKYLMVSAHEEFQATLSAVNFPPEFASCNGIRSLANGLFITQQKRHPFNLTYRTQIWSDREPLGSAYKIHFIYNAMANPTNASHSTLRQEPTMESFSWNIVTKPMVFPGTDPLSHLVVDSRYADPADLEHLEELIYGTDEQDPLLLSPGQVLSVLSGIPFEFGDD